MNIKIGKKELTGIMINLISMKLFLTYPRYVLNTGGNAAWIIGIYVLLIQLFIFYITDKIYRTKKSMLEIAEEIGGRIFKMIIGILMFFIIALNISFTLRVFPESVRMILLHGTPMAIILGVLIIACAIGAYNGVEAIARITALFIPLISVILIIFVFFIIPHFEVENIAPIFGKGSKALFVYGLKELSFYSDIIALNFLLPYSQSKKEAFRSGYKAILISGISLTVILLCVGFIYPTVISEDFIMPMYQLTRIVRLGDFFSRLEAFYEFIWCIAMMLYASIYFYILCEIWKESFNLKFYKPIIMPVAVICAAIAFIPDSIINIMEIYSIATLIIGIVAFLMPIIFGTLERIRNKL